MPPGRLLFARGGMLLQQRLDLDRLEVVGEPIPINEGILINQEAGLADFAVSPSGVLVYQSGTDGVNQFAWVDRQGKTVETVGARGRFRSFALSPDGQRLAYEDPTKGDIWILDVERQTSSRLTTTPGHEACPVWFPDGTKIAYRTNAGGVFVKEVSGTTVERRVADMFINGPSQFTPDGKALLCFWVPPDAQSQAVAVLPLTDKAAPQTIVRSAFANVEPQISPDGRWLAYASPESGRNEVYVQPFPPTGARWQVSSAGGRQPMWRGDSRELYFVADDRRFYAVDVTPGTHTFQCSAPHFLFEMRANVFNVRNSYLPRADGQQFLVNTLIENTGEPLNVVLNWQPR
jgi:Tol biopolymer transport system component